MRVSDGDGRWFGTRFEIRPPSFRSELDLLVLNQKDQPRIAVDQVGSVTMTAPIIPASVVPWIEQ